MTLGCGSWGNNITSDNVGPQHLLNVKRLAYETREYIPDVQASAPAASAPALASGSALAPASAWPPAESRADLSADIVGTRTGAGSGDSLESRIAGFLTKRGLLPSGTGAPPSAGRQTVVSVSDTGERGAKTIPPEPPRGRANMPAGHAPAPTSAPTEPQASPPATAPVDFVAEDDVRTAADRGEKIRIGPDTIITPSARELGEERGVFRRQ